MKHICAAIISIFLGSQALATTCTPEKTSKTVLGPHGPVTLSSYKQLSPECAAKFQARHPRR
jgi:hypothetical protein